MANPVLVDCPEGQWTKVATNVTTGVIHILKEDTEVYNHTYRMTGNPAPTSITEAVPFKGQLNISSSSGIDVYIWAMKKDGKVRVDI